MEAAFEFDPNEFDDLIGEILNRYTPGELIPHDYLKQVFNIENPKSTDYQDDESFIKAIMSVNFEYMTKVEKLKNDMLNQENYYLNNVRGAGYSLLLPNEQQQFAFDLAIKEMRKAAAISREIMCKCRFAEIDPEIRAKGSDLAMKLSGITQFVNSARKK